jgi:hypothetical protein
MMLLHSWSQLFIRTLMNALVNDNGACVCMTRAPFLFRAPKRRIGSSQGLRKERNIPFVSSGAAMLGSASGGRRYRDGASRGHHER